MKHRFLITGASGFIGSDILRYLIYNEHEAKGYSHLELNIMSGQSIKAAIRDYKPTILVNCSGFTDVDACENFDNREKMEVNFEGVKKLAKICRQENVFLIHLSTNFVFDGRKKGINEIYSEGDTCHPIQFYGKSKYLGERYLFSENSYSLCLRFGNPYNFYSEKSSIVKMNKLESVKCCTDMRISPVGTFYIAKIVELISEKRFFQGGILHIANVNSCSVHDFFSHVLNVKPSPCGLSDLRFKATRPMNSVLNPSKLNSYFPDAIKTWKASVILQKELELKILNNQNVSRETINGG